MKQIEWVEIPETPFALEELLIKGSGKDCDIILRRTDGRRVVLPLGDAAVAVRGTVHTESTSAGDTSRLVRYTGKDLRIVRGRVGYPDADFWIRKELIEAVPRVFGGSDDDLRIVVHAQIELAGSMADSA